MVKYRRYYVTGGVYFFTVVLQDRKSDWLIKYINQLTAAMKRVKKIHPYKVIAMVVLPNHLHVMWELPENDNNYSVRWRCIKVQFARNIRKLGFNVAKNRYGENVLWQRRFWEHAIRNEKDFETHVNYIHYNPVKHGHVSSPADWQYSSIHRFIREGIISANWSANVDISGGE